MNSTESSDTYSNRLIRKWLSLFLSLLLGYLILLGVLYFFDFILFSVLYGISFPYFLFIQALLSFLFALFVSKSELPRISTLSRTLLALFMPLILCFIWALDASYSNLISLTTEIFNLSYQAKESIYYLVLVFQIVAGLIFVKPWNNRISFITGTLYSSVLHILLIFLLFIFSL